MFQNASVKTKMVVILVLISAVPLLISIGVNFYSTMEKSIEQLELVSQQRVNVIDSNITGLFEQNRNGIRSLAVNAETIRYLQEPTVGAEEMDGSLVRTNEIFKDSNPTLITDTNGQQLLRSDHKEPVNTSTRADKHAKKVQAEEIEKRIRTDTDLTDEDRTKLQKRADELKRAGMTDEDKLSELYAKANELEKRVKDGIVTDREIEEPLSLYRQQIGQLKGTMREKSLRDLRLRGQAVQERADRDAEITKAQEKETAELEALQPGDLSALAALREYQKTAAGKKNADRSGIVIPTNKNTNDT